MANKIEINSKKSAYDIKNRSLIGHVLTGNECYTINIVWLLTCFCNGCWQWMLVMVLNLLVWKQQTLFVKSWTQSSVELGRRSPTWSQICKHWKHLKMGLGKPTLLQSNKISYCSTVHCKTFPKSSEKSTLQIFFISVVQVFQINTACSYCTSY